MRNKRYKSTIFLLALSVALGACSSPPRALSAEETAKLRQEYAFAGENPGFDINTIDDIRSMKIDSFVALVVVSVAGEQETETVTIPSEMSGFGASSVEAYYFPVHVDEVLYQTDQFPGDIETLIVQFNNSLYQTGYERMTPGKRFILPLLRPREGNRFQKYDDYYQSNLLFTFQLTDDDVVISFSDMPGTEKYTGWYLDSFGDELKRLLS